MSFSDWWNAIHALKTGELAAKAEALKNAADRARNGDERAGFLQQLKKVVWFTTTIAGIRNRYIKRKVKK